MSDLDYFYNKKTAIWTAPQKLDKKNLTIGVLFLWN